MAANVTSTPAQVMVPTRHQTATVTVPDMRAASWKSALVELDIAVNSGTAKKVTDPMLYFISDPATGAWIVTVEWDELPF